MGDLCVLLQLAASARAPEAAGLEALRGNAVPYNLMSSPPGITRVPGFLWVSCVLGHQQMSPVSPRDTPNAGEWFALPGFCLILPFLQPTAGRRNDNLAINLQKPKTESKGTELSLLGRKCL